MFEACLKYVDYILSMNMTCKQNNRHRCKTLLARVMHTLWITLVSIIILMLTQWKLKV